MVAPRSSTPSAREEPRPQVFERYDLIAETLMGVLRLCVRKETTKPH